MYAPKRAEVVGRLCFYKAIAEGDIMSHPIHVKVNNRNKKSRVNSKQYIANSLEPSDGIYQYETKRPIAMLLKRVDISRQQFRLIAQKLRNKKTLG
jgi:hypothetical protein